MTSKICCYPGNKDQCRMMVRVSMVHDHGKATKNIGYHLSDLAKQSRIKASYVRRQVLLIHATEFSSASCVRDG